jgi:hypothetical protein
MGITRSTSEAITKANFKATAKATDKAEYFLLYHMLLNSGNKINKIDIFEN